MARFPGDPLDNEFRDTADREAAALVGNLQLSYLQVISGGSKEARINHRKARARK